MDALLGLCSICGGDNLHHGDDGFFYCSTCGSQSQQFQEQGCDFQDNHFKGSTKRSKALPTSGEGADPLSQPNEPQEDPFARLESQFGYTDDGNPWDTFGRSQPDVPGGSQKPVDPEEARERLASDIRKCYVEGLQEMLQLQCETVVQSFGVTPLVCGIAGPVWLRFLAFTRVFQEDWAKEAVEVEEAREEKRRKRNPQDVEDGKSRKKKSKSLQEPRTSHGTKASLVWLAALKERIPVAVTLALVYLACHVARETVLPTDLVKWALEGSLPYLAAFSQIGKKSAAHNKPLEARLMFQPTKVISARKLEFMAASIAKRTGLQLPPVNFHAISCRLLKQLKLPIEQLSVHVCRFFDWYTPSGLWLSDEKQALPSRVYVMAMVMIVLKVLYRIDGRGYWEELLATGEDGVATSASRKLDKGKQVGQTCGSDDPSEACEEGKHDPWSGKLLLKRLARSLQDEGPKRFDYEKDLPTYLKYCQDVIFPGTKISTEEENMCERLWRLYEKPPDKATLQMKDTFSPERFPAPASSNFYEESQWSSASSKAGINLMVEESAGIESVLKNQETREEICAHGVEDRQAGNLHTGFRSLDEFIDLMEGSGFSYLPPLKNPVPSDRYPRYFRKSTKGTSPQQFCHADHFILLCACAKVINVEPDALFWCVQRVEKGLRWMEGKVKDVIQSETEKVRQGEHGYARHI